jgi:large subunit ribosomal protein L9
MEIILLERIGKLGQMGDTVTVKDGFARNYLLPQGKALRATDTNKERFEKDRSQLEARNLELKKEADAVAEKLDSQSFTVIRQAGDTGQLYGSVSTRDIADLVTAAGYSVARHQIQLDKPIKVLGIHALHVSLHPEVSVSVNVNVARSEDEAKRQARGEDVTAEILDYVDEETIDAEEVFEDEDLVKQAEEALADEAAAPADEADAADTDAGDTAEEPAASEEEEGGEDEKKDD